MTVLELLGLALAEKALQGSYSAYPPEGFVPPADPMESGLPHWKGLYRVELDCGCVVARRCDVDDSHAAIRDRIAETRVERKNRRKD